MDQARSPLHWDGCVVMSLATSFLTVEQVQLLADCIEPVLVLEIPASADMLMHRGLLVSSECICNQGSCHVLAVTERGRSYVSAWVERQERTRRRGETFGRQMGFSAMGSS
jgi:hypothetical protein